MGMSASRLTEVGETNETIQYIKHASRQLINENIDENQFRIYLEKNKTYIDTVLTKQKHAPHHQGTTLLTYAILRLSSQHRVTNLLYEKTRLVLEYANVNQRDEQGNLPLVLALRVSYDRKNDFIKEIIQTKNTLELDALDQAHPDSYTTPLVEIAKINTISTQAEIIKWLYKYLPLQLEKTLISKRHPSPPFLWPLLKGRICIALKLLTPGEDLDISLPVNDDIIRVMSDSSYLYNEFTQNQDSELNLADFIHRNRLRICASQDVIHGCFKDPEYPYIECKNHDVLNVLSPDQLPKAATDEPIINQTGIAIRSTGLFREPKDVINENASEQHLSQKPQ